MNRFWIPFLGVLVVLAVVGNLSCGTSSSSNLNRQLQSIEITPTSATAQNFQAQFTATGHYNTPPMTVSNLPASWIVIGPNEDLPGPGYTLVSPPFTASCRGSGAFVVIAYAPMDPKLPDAGSVPTDVWNALVSTQKMGQLDGFVGTTAQMTCP